MSTPALASPAASSSSSDGAATPPSTDARHPLYLSDAWKRSLPSNPEHTDCAYDAYDEPHLKRKAAILRAHPAVAQLYGYDLRTIAVAVVLVTTQLAIAYGFGRVWTVPEGASTLSYWLAFGLCAYIVGGTITGLYGVVLHEACHNLCHPSPLVNRWVGLFTNVGMPMPIAMGFRRHHLEHHTYQGVHGRDPDLPMAWEIRFIKGSTLLKIIWMFCFPVMYMWRGLALKKMPSFWEKVNFVWTLATDVVIWRLCGPMGFAYIFASTWLGYGLHPGAAHFIQEHYTFVDGQETYSYYGKGNSMFMNIGFHNEHHDFTKVPWSRLPDIKRLANEFYEPLGAHYSWRGVLWHFLTSSDFGPQSRVERTPEVHRQGRAEMRKLR